MRLEEVGMGVPTDSSEKDRISRLEGKVTETQLTIAQLLAKERELSQIIESMPIAAFVINRAHCITHLNAAFEHLTGVKREDLLHTKRQWSPFYTRRKKTLADLVVDNATSAQIEAYYGKESRRISHRDGAYAVELFFPHLGNTGKWIFCTASPLNDHDEAVIGAVETLQDLTSRKEVEEALFKSEEKSRIILDQIEDGYYEVDLQGRVIFFNDAFCMIIGYSKADMVGMSYKEFAGPRYTKKIFTMYNRVFRTGRPIKAFEWEIVRKDGTKRLVEFSVSLMRDASNAPTGFRGIVRDVTDARRQDKELVRYKNHLEELVQERTSELNKTNRRLTRVIDNLRKAEKNLLKQKNFSEGIIRSLPCIFYMIDKSGHFIKWNKNTEEIGGYSTDEMSGVHALDFFPQREKANIAEKIREVFIRGRAFTNTTVLGRDGRETPHYFTGVRTHIDGKRYQVGVGIDTSDAVRAEKALRESEEKLSAILGSVTDYMIIVDRSYSVVWANEKARSLFPDLMNNKCHQVIHGSRQPCDPCIGEGCFKTGGAYEREGTCIIPGSGERMDFWSTTSIVTRQKDGSPELILELFRDITEKKAYEAEAVRVGQLASLGELAAGVAHEINNPINGILNYVQILLESAGRPPSDHEILQRIVREGERVTRIVHNLLSFARVRNDEFISTSLDEVLSACIGLVAKQLANDGITLRMDTGGKLPRLYCNSQQLQQVFLNIISNARYALNQKYRGVHRNKIIEIRAEKTRMKKRKALRIVVCDHGTGIPEEILDKIGSPFFTTKPLNEGTGLGLNISHGIIRNHGGRLWFDSRAGEFTKVVIDLPAHQPGESHAGP
jgi:PAS domain S-box-containing protein